MSDFTYEKRPQHELNRSANSNVSLALDIVVRSGEWDSLRDRIGNWSFRYEATHEWDTNETIVEFEITEPREPYHDVIWDNDIKDYRPTKALYTNTFRYNLRPYSDFRFTFAKDLQSWMSQQKQTAESE